MMKQSSDRTMLEKYLRNQCSDAELAQVFDLLQTPDGQVLLQNLMDAAQAQTDVASQGALPSVISDTMWDRIKNQTQKSTVSQHKIGYRPRWAVAASVSVLVAVALGYLAMVWYPNRQTEHQTAFGQMLKVTLPDGSVVTLNGNSTVRYKADWAADQPREIWLDGEGFFSVRHKTNNQKFTVHANNQCDIEVLGTEFNVNGRGQKTKVVLQSGKIRLVVKEQENTRQVIMKPGDLVEIMKAAEVVAVAGQDVSSVIQQKIVDPSHHVSWKEQQLVFDETSLLEIAGILRETYGITLVLPEEKYYYEKITGTVPSGNTDELLNALALTLGMRYEKENNQVKFKQ